MPSDEATRSNIPALIQEARHVYQTEPVAAALMLYKGLRGLKRTTTPSFNDQGKGRDQQTASHGQSVLQAALWSLDVMGEDAQLGIAPTPSEWDLNISVAESVVHMMGTSDDPA